MTNQSGSLKNDRLPNLYIVGAGGFAREVLQWAKDCNAQSLQWHIKGFVSKGLDDLGDKECDYAIVNTIDAVEPEANDLFLLAVGNPGLKQKLQIELASRGAEFTTLVHPTARLASFVEVGEGVIICPNAEVSPNVKLGPYVTLLNCGIGHDVTVDAFSTVSGGAYLNGNVALGKSVFVGCGAVVAPGKKVADEATIGIGSVVIRNVRSGEVVFGNPAKRIGRS